MMSAMSSRLAMMRSNQRRKICARSFGNVFAQGPKARCAASIAPIVSASPKRGVFASTAPVAGLAMGRVPSPTHLPSTRHWLLRSERSASFMGKASEVGGLIAKREGDGEAEFCASGRRLPDQRNGSGDQCEDRKHDEASRHGLDEMMGRESRKSALGRSPRDLDLPGQHCGSASDACDCAENAHQIEYRAGDARKVGRRRIDRRMVVWRNEYAQTYSESDEAEKADPEVGDRFRHDQSKREERDKADRHPRDAEEARPHPVGQRARDWRNDADADRHDRELEPGGDGTVFVPVNERE